MQELRKEKKETKVKRNQIKESLLMKREKAKKLTNSKREKFKAKLQTIKDQKKQALVKEIDAKLENINTKHTDRFAEVLDKLQKVLDEVSAKATEKKVIAHVKTTQLAIDSARIAVDNQGAKIYIITISTEKVLRPNTGAAISQLRLDLMATHKLVVDAKQAVQKLRENSAIIEKQATNSANL